MAEKIDTNNLPDEDKFDSFWGRLCRGIALTAGEYDHKIRWAPTEQGIKLEYISDDWEEEEEEGWRSVRMRRECLHDSHFEHWFVVLTMNNYEVRISPIPSAVWAVLYA